MRKTRNRGTDPEMEAKVDALNWAGVTKPEDRLRWVLAFSEEKLDALSTAERLERTERLLALYPPQGESSKPAYLLRMTDDGLRSMQRTIREGLRYCLNATPTPNVIYDVLPGTWRVPGPAWLNLCRTTARFTKGAKGAETAPKKTRF